jgi:tetratricopeptide (TPR) repeat protein
MKLRHFLATAGAALAATSATAAVTVIGNTSARLCYEAAESKAHIAQGLGYCDKALRDESLSTSDTVATHVNRGILKLRRGELDNAIADFDRAIGMDADEAEAYLNKGLAVLRRPDGKDEAVRLFDTALAKKTRKPAVAYYARGVAHELNGRVRQAYLDYRQASAADPKWAEPKAELARFTVRRP